MSGSRSAVLISLIDTTENYGLKYVHASLLNGGFESQIVFYTSEDESYFDEVAQFVRDRSPDLVGISLMSRFFPAAAGLSNAIRKTCNDNVPILWGGVHPTIDPESCKEHADYVCVGEGEHALVQFLQQLDGGRPIGDVAGIAAAGTTGHTIRPAIEDLDSLPFPEILPRNSWVTDAGGVRPLNDSLLKKHTAHHATYLAVMTSRGCPFACAYCCNNLFQRIYGKKIRRRSPENVVAEIERNLSGTAVPFHYISLSDDCFTAHSTAWLETFVKYYRKIGLPLVFRAIPQFVTEEKISILKEAPCGFALIGLQSGSERTLAEVFKRRHSNEAFLNCTELLHANDIPAVYDIIVDNPYETQTDIEHTVEVVAHLPKSSYVSVFSLTFYKYTELYDRAKSDGYPVDEHLTKSQDAWLKSSREVQALKIAALLNKRIALAVLHYGEGWKRIALSVVTFLAVKVLEPVRHLKLTYLSRGKSKRAFIGALLPHVRDYVKRYFSLSEVNKHKH